MPLRRAAPVLFAALCLGLSALVLRRQIAAHPAPRRVAAPSIPDGPPEPVNPGLPTDPNTWRVASGPVRDAVMKTVVDQLGAIRRGDADRAWSFQSRGLHQNFHSARDFEAAIVSGYPEFGHARRVVCGPVWADGAGDHANTVVMVTGEDGKRAQGYYQLVREDGGYKVAGVMGGRALK